jgi:hypothetical protein
MPASILKIALAAACVGSLCGTGMVVAQDGQQPDSTFSVGPRQLLEAGDPSPVDFAGVRGDARGTPIARGATVVGYRVTITRGQTAGFPAFTIRCPAGKVLKTFGADGTIGPQIVGRSPFVRRTKVDYANKPSWGVVVRYGSDTAVGQTRTGNVYGYCR